MRPRNPRFDESAQPFFEFKGIVNTVSERDRALAGLTAAKNLEVTPTNKLQRRAGYSSFASGPYDGLYATSDHTRMYGVSASGNLVRLAADGNAVVLATGYARGYYRWAEAPDRSVYFSNGASNGIITPHHRVLPLVVAAPPAPAVEYVQSLVVPAAPLHIGKTYAETQVSVCATYTTEDGREGPASDITTLVLDPEVSRLRVTVPQQYAATTIYCTAPGGTEYFEVASWAQTSFLVPVANLYSMASSSQPPLGVSAFPNAAHICFYKGRLYAGVYDPQTGLSVVYMSEPLGWHLFDLAKSFLTLDGELRLMLPTDKGLVLGTSTAVYGWTDDSLTQLSSYGVIAGRAGAVAPDDTAYFWTLRGVCKAFPFAVVTEPYFSGDPGVQNFASLVQREGFARLTASTISGGTVFNSRTER